MSTKVEEAQESDRERTSSLPTLAGQRPFWLLYVATFIVGFGQSMLFSILPPIARATGLDEIQVALIFAIPTAAFVITSPLWGRASDRWGRKPIIVIGASAYAASMIVVGLGVQTGISGLVSVTGMFVILVISRGVNGLFGSGTHPAAQAYIADHTTLAERTQALAKLAAGGGIGNVVGPSAGAFLVLITLYTPFYLVAACGAVVVLFLWRILESDSDHFTTVDRPKRPWFSPFDPRVSLFLLMIGINGVVMSTIMQTISFYLMDTMHLQPQEAARYGGSALAAIAAAQLFVQLFLIPRFNLNPTQLIPRGALIAVVGMFLVVASPVYAGLIIGMGILGLSAGMLGPGLAAACSLSVSPEEQGGVAGLMSAVTPIGFIISPISIMPLYKVAPQIPYMITFTLTIVLAILALRHPKIKHIGKILSHH